MRINFVIPRYIFMSRYIIKRMYLKVKEEVIWDGWSVYYLDLSMKE
jgi:hypothetical protein